jgi:hypothetical protein
VDVGQNQKFVNKSYMNWDVTLEIARGKLEGREPQLLASRAAVSFNEGDQEFIVSFLNQEHRVKYPSGEVYRPDGEETPIANKILILHYLEHAEGVPLHHKWISFKELPCGQIYINPFNNRAIRPLLKLFGQDPQGLIRAGLALGGWKESFGNASVAVPVFPMVPVVYVIWEGDEEFAATGNILFDQSAPSYLPLEDCVVIASTALFELRKILDRQA